MKESISIKAHNSRYQLKTTQTLYCKERELWKFICNPNNLSLITPSDLHFQIISSKVKSKIFEGQKIKYTIQPFLKFHILWQSEIHGVIPGLEFQDKQIEGPFAYWNHHHKIDLADLNKIIMHDIVDYELPYGKFGQAFGEFLINKKLKEIFEYRKEKFDLFFNKHEAKAKDFRFM
ncbi:MAG: hypothetical protein ACEPOW_07885 [Bacteroidales bacterium]